MVILTSYITKFTQLTAPTNVRDFFILGNLEIISLKSINEPFDFSVLLFMARLQSYSYDSVVKGPSHYIIMCGCRLDDNSSSRLHIPTVEKTK